MTVDTGSKRGEWLASLALLAGLAVLAYGPWLTRLGFYRDDWYVLWAGAVRGPGSIVTLFSIDRPLVGYLFSGTYALFRDSALAWQLYALALRWLTAALSLVLLRGLWPERRIATTAAAALMLLYPGFLQQPNAMTFSNQLTTLVVALLSLVLTLAAARSARRWAGMALTAAALLTALLYQLLYEYMIGLEVGRILVLWLQAPGEPTPLRRARWILRRWAPYALVTLGQLLWRAAVFHSERSATDLAGVSQAYLGRPLRLIAQQGLELGKDMVDILLAGWGLPYYQLSSSAELRAGATAALLAAVGVAACAWYAARVGRAVGKEDGPGPERDGRQMALFGGILLVLGQVPLIFAFRDVRWGNGFDRYSLQATVAAAAVMVGLLWAFARPTLRGLVVLGLVGLSISTHILNGQHWARFWEAQQQLWWQLSWRAPQIHPGTVLLAELPIDGYYEDYEAWGPANLIYYPESREVLIASEVLTEETAEEVRLGLRERREMRAIVHFARDHGRALIVSRPTEDSCVHVLNGDRPEFPLEASGLVRNLAAFSETDWIDVGAATGPTVPRLFGPEPEHGWCYLYQRAQLARQRGDWEGVLRLAREVEERDLQPGDRSEWVVFLEGAVHAGQAEIAQVIALRIRYRERLRHDLCDQIAGAPSPGMTPEAHQTVVHLLCAFE